MSCCEQRSLRIRQFVEIFSKTQIFRITAHSCEDQHPNKALFSPDFVFEMLVCMGAFSIQSLVLMIINKT